MSGAQVHYTSPPGWFFDFPPAQQPQTLLPPGPTGYDSWLKNPFTIPEGVFHATLSPYFPLTFAVIYVATVASINKYNRDNGNKAWSISKTKGFFAFVILHNVALAVYSLVTFLAMIRATRASYKGTFSANGVPGVIDTLCKLHGPRGFGSAIEFNPETQSWNQHNKLISLGPDGQTPDPTDVGRLWNEGLGWWGYFFYLSKFYEVVDTAIILAKGKRSSTLQTYHHSGAMLCMWAGIRYMSGPIWLFCVWNSGIHALMYTYYTVAALGIYVPKQLKRLLTTMQIMQFLVGMVFAVVHFFISYDVPVSVPFNVASALSAVPSAASSAAASFVDSAEALYTSASVGVAAAAASADSVAWAKKMAYRAAGAEGLAQNVHNKDGERFGAEYSAGPTFEMPNIRDQVRYSTEYKTVRCLDSNGAAFAVWLNAFYLLPLTFLFGRFFVKTYFTARPTKAGTKDSKSIPKALNDAGRRTSDAVEKLGREAEDSFVATGREIKQEGQQVIERTKQNGHALNGKATNGKPVNGNAVNGSATNGSAKKSTANENGHATNGHVKQEYTNGDLRESALDPRSDDAPSYSEVVKEE